MWHIIILIGILFCAFQAVRNKGLLVSAMWLAGTSALVSIMLYLLGAYQIAVIQLSVGAGLVTVLFTEVSEKVQISIEKTTGFFLQWLRNNYNI